MRVDAAVVIGRIGFVLQISGRYLRPLSHAPCDQIRQMRAQLFEEHKAN